MLTLSKHKYMRTPIALILQFLFLGFSIEADAQYKSRYNRSGSTLEVKYGLKLGYHLSNFTGDEFIAETNSDNISISPVVDYTILSSFHAGGYMEIRFSESFALQPELYLGIFGTEMIREADLDNPGDNFMTTPASDPLRIVEVPIQQRLLMINLPVVAKAQLSPGLSLDFGPLMSLKRKEEDRYGDVPDSLIAIVGFTDPLAPDKYRDFNFGGLVGLSYQLENGFNASIRYSRTISNINKNDRLALLAEEPKNSTSAILVSFGYTFNFLEDARQKVRLSN